MSVESISRVLRDSRAEGTARLVLIVIANHDGDGGAWPSVATLARGARVSERSVQRAIHELQELGEIVVHRNDGGTRKTRPDRRPNRYEITINAAGNGATPSSPRPPERGDTHDTPLEEDGVTPTTQRGDTPVTRTVLNHPIPPTPTTGCPAHTTPAANCRGCGTSKRQTADHEAENRRRAQNAAAAAADRATPRADPIANAAAREAAKAAAAEARRQAQAAIA